MKFLKKLNPLVAVILILGCSEPQVKVKFKDSCSVEDVKELCSNVPYKDGQYIEHRIFRLMGCVFKPGDIIKADRINEWCR